KNPTQAVCTEFTDLFVALARQKNIYAREIEGYGYSVDENLRPITTNSDVLHAWPEYYDSSIDQWVAVDPTWQSTSGINYFSSLDLNHIIFAIHGKDPEYPLPGGTYKIKDSKDVSVEPTKNIPNDSISLTVKSFDLHSRVFGNQMYNTKLFIQNTSNIYLWNVPIEIKSPIGLNKTVTVNVIAPMEVKEIPITFKSVNVHRSETKELEISAFQKEIFSKEYQLMPKFYDIGLKVGLTIIFFSIFFFIARLLKSRFKHSL
ncbi:MAG: transglutaminase domain-containing protein, partial [Patescibacteria group bacterium]